MDPNKDLERALRGDEPLQIWTERRRYGKEVTIVSGFDPGTDVDDVARTLKHRLAVGGSAKEGHVELQGDQRARARMVLSELGFEAA